MLSSAVSSASHIILCSICNISTLFPCCSPQYLQGLASWLPPEAGMFMWMKLEGGVRDADDIIDALKDEQVAVVPGQHHTHQTLKLLVPFLLHPLAHARFWHMQV